MSDAFLEDIWYNLHIYLATGFYPDVFELFET